MGFILCELWDLFSVKYGMYFNILSYFLSCTVMHNDYCVMLGIVKIMTNVLHNRVIITSLMHDNHFWENTVN